MPGAFGDLALTFVLAQGAVRVGQIVLFAAGSAGDPKLLRSIMGLGLSTGIALSLMLVGVAASPEDRLWIWTLALVLDVLGPFLFGADGWKLAPAHFAERHGLIFIIALGESIIAIGASAAHP